MGTCGSSLAHDFVNDSIRTSFVGYYVKSRDIQKLVPYFVQYKFPTLYRIPSEEHQLFLVVEGEVEVCGHSRGTASPKTDDSGRVPLSTLLSSVRTLKPGSVFVHFGGDGTGVSCVCSGSSPVTIMSISKAIVNSLADDPDLKHLTKFCSLNIGAVLKKAPLFSGMSEEDFSTLGPLLHFEWISPGDALTLRGKTGAAIGACAIFLDGQMVEVPGVNNYQYPTDTHSLHDEIGAPTRNKRRVSTVVPATVAELELEDTVALVDGFRMLWTGEVVGENLCFFPGMAASATVVAREKSIVGIITRPFLEKMERILDVPLVSRLKKRAVLMMLRDLRAKNVIFRVMTETELELIAERCQMEINSGGTKILNENDEIHSYYVLLQGGILYSTSREPSAEGAAPASRGVAYAAIEATGAASDFPFSPLAPAKTAISSKSTKNRVSALNNFSFPVASAIMTMVSAYTLTASNPSDASIKYGEATKSAMLNIPQRVIDEAVFQRPFESESTDHIKSSVDDVDLTHVLRHSIGYNSFHEYLNNERSAEGIYFWKAAERFSILCSRFEMACPTVVPPESEFADIFRYVSAEMSSRLKACIEITSAIITHYVREGSFLQVNIPHTHCNSIEAGYKDLVASTDSLLSASNDLIAKSSVDAMEAFVIDCNKVFQAYAVIFAKAKQEVYLLMREDSFKRWRRTQGFSNFIKKTVGMI